MRNDLTAAFLAEMVKDETTPFQLLVFHFDGGDVYLADRDVSVDGQDYQGLVTDWGTLSTVGAENAISSTMELNVTLWNGGEYPFSLYFLAEDPVDVRVDVFQTYQGLTAADFAHIGEFVIQDPIEYSEASRLLSLELVTTNMRYFAQVGSLMTEQDYQNALSSDINKPIDLIVGNAGTVVCLCSQVPPTTTLDRSVVKSTITIEVTDNLDDLGFPINHGRVQINEEIIEYNSRTSYSITASARGADGTIATNHSASSQVIQIFETKKVTYIVGQGPIDDITNVKVRGKDPRTTYNAYPGRNPAVIEFDAQPTYVSAENTASGTVYPDATVLTGDDALYGYKSYSGNYKAEGAVMYPGHRNLHIKNTEDNIAEHKDLGDIVNLFLNVTHWSHAIVSQDDTIDQSLDPRQPSVFNFPTREVTVQVDGVYDGANLKTWTLTGPNKANATGVVADTAIDHPHDHVTAGGEHDHYSDDPDFSSSAGDHVHGITDGAGQQNGTLSSYALGESICHHGDDGYKIVGYVPANVANFTKAVVRIAITGGTVGYGGTDNRYPTIKIGGVTLDLQWDKNSYVNVTITDPNSIDVFCVNQKTYGSSEVPYVCFKIASVTIHTEATITNPGVVDVATVKTSSGNVAGNTVPIKNKADILPLVEGQTDSNKDLQDKETTEFSKTITDSFDILDFVGEIDWTWFKDRQVKVRYTTGNANIVEHIGWVDFTVEYKKREVATTYDVTCDAVGSIGNRPDQVIEYLLTKKAGVPLDLLGSVWRDVPVWVDTDVWWDLDPVTGEQNIWRDEGQTTEVVGAAFDEAAAWFQAPAHNYTIDGIISGNSTVKDAIANITWQTRSKLTWQNGKVKLSVSRKSEDWNIAKNIDTDDVQLKSYSVKRSSVNDIINKIDLFYDIDRLSDVGYEIDKLGMTSPGGPEGTINASAWSGKYRGTASLQDDDSIYKHGERVDDGKWLFDLVRNKRMAGNLVSYYLWLYGETSSFYTLRTYLNNFDLEKQDWATISSSGFDRLNNLPVVISELVREFGSGTIDKINTLKMVCQSIRYKSLAVFVRDTVHVFDSMSFDFNFDSRYNEIVNVYDLFRFIREVSNADTVTVSDTFYSLYTAKSVLRDTVSVTDELRFNYNVVFNDIVKVVDNMGSASELCWGACGFGAPNCEIPFGSKTKHPGFFVEAVKVVDNMTITIQ